MSHTSVDGIRYRPMAQSPPRRPARPVQPLARPQPSTAHYKQHVIVAPSRPSMWQRLQPLWIVSGGIVCGFLVQSLWLGIALLAAYSIFVIVFRIKSYITFILAIISLMTVGILTIKAHTDLANNFAAYAFLLLTIGVIALAVEVRPQRRRQKRQRGR